MTKVIGLTGPTGAGKSVAAAAFAQAGAVIIDCDQLAREAVEQADCCAALCEAFGADICENGVLNRKRLAERAFCRKDATAVLNRITHPAILAKLEDNLAQHKEENRPAVVIDAPLLFEGGVDRYCDVTIAVVADYPVRLERIMHRDGITEQQARARMAAQNDNDWYAERCDYVFFCNEKENRKAFNELFMRAMQKK